jgi:hypothetical protein
MSDSFRRWLVPALAGLGLAAAAAFALYGAFEDSLTVDEPSHLVAGYVALTAGDHRLSPDHPPLARMLLALPLAGSGAVWRPGRADAANPVQDPTPAVADAAWRSGDFFTLGRAFFESWNDGQRLARPSRFVAVGVLLALLATIGLVARRHFGAAGGVVALLVAALDPTLLAHGHLATIDVPFALAALLALVAADRWLAQPTPARLALAALAFAAATLVKFSWIALVPALVAIAIAARKDDGARAALRTVALGGAALALGAVLAIWAAYGFRFPAARGDDAAIATMHVLGDQGRPRPATPAAAWEAVLHDPATGVDRRGLAAPVLRFVHRAKLLPEAYLYGIAYVAKKGLTRASYFRGRYSTEGFAGYFPGAFLIKTPLSTLALFALGLWAAAARWRRGANISPLAWGFAVFAVAYLAALGSSALNLGVRHLLPIMVLLAIAAGGAWTYRDDEGRGPSRRAARGRGMVIGLLGCLALETLVTSPYFLGYFNLIAGGWSNGHRHLADSNIDWGQDLLRLEARLREEPPGMPVWLAQASDPPMPRGLAELRPRWLFGEGSHAPHPAPVEGGLFAISATELLGVYRPLARAEAWRDPQWSARFEQLGEEQALARRSRDASVAKNELTAYEALRRLRLISRLAQRAPSERVGTSFFLFRLSDEQVAEMTTP